jgi:hypothetical protein
MSAAAPTGNKIELAAALGCSLPTLSAWMMKYRPEFPIQSAGTNGRSYVFDFKAVFDFLRTKQEEQAAATSERDAALAQLRLPFDVPGADLPLQIKPSIGDEIKAMQLRRLQREEAEKSGALVPAEQIGAALAGMLARLSRDTRAFIQQLAREQDWPPGYTQAVLARYADTQRSAVKDLQAQFAAGDLTDDARQQA